MKSAPGCRCCGKPIRKYTVTVWPKLPGRIMQPTTSWSRDVEVEQLPSTIEECRRLTNLQVIALRKNRDGTIYRFTEWDGEHYLPTFGFFCTTECAARFGEMAAKAGFRRKVST
jgi:hypothetical protein